MVKNKKSALLESNRRPSDDYFSTVRRSTTELRAARLLLKNGMEEQAGAYHGSVGEPTICASFGPSCACGMTYLDTITGNAI